MSNPRFVKVFLASSITELKDERRDIAALERDIVRGRLEIVEAEDAKGEE